MPRDFTIPNVNELTSSYGTSTTIPIILNTPGILSIKKNEPYIVTVDTNK